MKLYTLGDEVIDIDSFISCLQVAGERWVVDVVAATCCIPRIRPT